MQARQDVDDAEERGSLSTWFVRAGVATVPRAMRSAGLRDVARQLRRAAAYVPARSADRAPPTLSMLA